MLTSSTTPPDRLSPDELLRVIATPTSLGSYLAEDLWGPGSTYEIDPWLQLAEDRAISALLDAQQRFLRIHCPPQIGKTSFSGGFLPFWLLGMFPDRRIIFITYSDDYSRMRGGQVRDMVRAYGKALFGIEIDPEQDSRGDWKLKGHQGGMLSVGIGSQISGRSGDIIIIDDLIKNMVEASSTTTKANHVREWDATIRPRLQPGGTVIMTSTRWAEDDLAGALEHRTRQPDYIGDDWEVLSFPAIAEPSDAEIEQLLDDADFAAWEDELGRRAGQPLQCRYTDPDLPWEDTTFYRIQRSGDPYTFSCVYQQRPTSREGGMFPMSRWARYRRDEAPRLVATCRVWEPAATEGGGDWSIGLKVGKDADGRIFVLDAYRQRISSDRVLADALVLARADGFDVTILMEQERAGAGKGVVTLWNAELVKIGHRAEPMRAEGSKEQRAVAASTLQQAGQVYLPEEQLDWVAEMIDQGRKMMGDGRRGRHDDLIDALSYAVLHLVGAGESYFWDPADVNPAAEDEMEAALMRHVLGI